MAPCTASGSGFAVLPGSPVRYPAHYYFEPYIAQKGARMTFCDSLRYQASPDVY